MVRDINGLGGVSNTSSRPNESSSRPDKAPVADGNSSAQSASQQDGVELSSQAQTLQALENKLQAVPEVDVARVEAIKQALEEGNFKIDDLVVADKLINSDTLLGE